MYIEHNCERFYISRAYWVHSFGYTIYEFANKYGDTVEIEVLVNESLEDKVDIYVEEE